MVSAAKASVPAAAKTPRNGQAYEMPYGTVQRVARKQVLVQLDDALVAALDRRANEAGVSRSELIRTAIADHLRDLDWEEADRAAIEAYRRVPEDARELPALDRLAVEILGDEERNEP
jgi:predicted transcriptional regulator